MFNIYIDDGNLNFDELDDICYIITKNGNFLRKKIGLTDALVEVKNISHLSSNLKQFGKLNIPKIPQEHFSRIVKFFMWAYKKYNSESVVLIYYNQDENKFELFPTAQEVSGASASYIREGNSHNGFLLIGTIHSHANFGAGHSGIDNDDELNFDGIHITVGNVNDTYQSISCSIVINGKRFFYEPETYIEGLVRVKNSNNNTLEHLIDEDYDMFNQIFSSSILFGENSYASNNEDRFLIKGLTIAKFDEDWKDKVQKRILKSFKINNVYNTNITKNDTNENDNNLFKNKFKQYLNNFCNDKSKTEIDMKTIKDNDNMIPCENCIYKDYKSQLIIQEVLEGMGDIFDEDEIMYYAYGITMEDDNDDDNEIYNSET